MADEAVPPQEEQAKKGNLAEDWKKLATWQKAGVIIAGVGVVAAIIYYVNKQPSPQATGNAGALAPGFTGMPNTNAGTTPGSGDQFPPVPVPPTTQPTPPVNTPPTGTFPSLPVGKYPPYRPTPGNYVQPVAAQPLATHTSPAQLQASVISSAQQTFGHGGIGWQPTLRVNPNKIIPLVSRFPIRGTAAQPRQAAGISNAQWNALRSHI